MSSVADLVAEETLKSLARPADVRLGREIYETGEVEAAEFSPLRVVAKVRPSEGLRRTVELIAQGETLTWKCTCTSDTKLFCKHCVAAALMTWEKAPESR
jgi:uncharacterized Zn finger protein